MIGLHRHLRPPKTLKTHWSLWKEEHSCCIGKSNSWYYFSPSIDLWRRTVINSNPFLYQIIRRSNALQGWGSRAFADWSSRIRVTEAFAPGTRKGRGWPTWSKKARVTTNNWSPSKQGLKGWCTVAPLTIMFNGFLFIVQLRCNSMRWSGRLVPPAQAFSVSRLNIWYLYRLQTPAPLFSLAGPLWWFRNRLTWSRSGRQTFHEMNHCNW